MADRKQKLELTWTGKESRINVEPRILLEDKEKSYSKESSFVKDTLFEDANTPKPTFDNMLIHGDNLLALKALEAEYAGKVKCIYIDPPYNTGNAFEHYDDGVEHSIWLSLMRDRLEILRNLLSDDGVIFVQIDDNEFAYLKVLCDEVFGRTNFVNIISVNMKNIAGASGGGEDKRLKKNCEFILAYSKKYDCLPIFKGVFDYEEISELVERYKKEKISWKYTSVFLDEGQKEYITSTVDGDGNEIKIFKHTNYIFKSIGVVAKENNISEKDVYYNYADKIVRTTMPQSSIRPRVMKKLAELSYCNDLISIEYTPKTGKNKGNIYTQYYKGDKYNLFAWLSDVLEEKNGVFYKKTLQGTYWDFTASTKNLTKEGSVEFPNGKKPEALIERILDMSTKPGDLVLDSFLGSGTTCAVAHKMGRRWIGIEMGNHCYTHCIPRLQKVINGEDAGGITKSTGWQGGGGFKFYELGSSLIEKDFRGFPVISEKYNPEMLAEAMCKIMGYKYAPDFKIFWKQGIGTEKSYLFTTTVVMTEDYISEIESMLGDNKLLICCEAFIGNSNAYKNIKIKKIPSAILNKCEWGKPSYPLPVREDFTDDDFEFEEDD